MFSVTFNKNRCIACGLCARTCPINRIGRDGEGKPVLRADGIPCLGCGHCIAICPQNALAEPSREDMKSAVLPMTGEERERAIALMRRHRSCRSYADKPVPQELIERAIDAARYAPSGKNAQPVEWTVIGDREIIRKLARQFYEKAKSNPALKDRYKYVGETEDPIYRDAPVLVLAHGDPKMTIWSGDGIIAATVFDYAAQALGLGTCWSGTSFSAEGSLKKAAGIPDEHTIYAAIMAGFPEERFLRLPGRKPLSVRWI